MRIFALCTIPAQASVAKATGKTPLTSPPLNLATFDGKMMEGYDVLYFRLHGIPSIPGKWFGEDDRGGLVAVVDERHLQGVNLSGATVILANCYGKSSPLVQEFYRAGAGAVIAGSGPNYASGSDMIGTDRLAYHIINRMQAGICARTALNWAKGALTMNIWRQADRDTLEFSIVDKE